MQVPSSFFFIFNFTDFSHGVCDMVSDEEKERNKRFRSMNDESVF